MGNDLNKAEHANRRKRGIYLLPNFFTTGNLFAGFYSIIAASQGHFIAASVAIFIGMLADMLDGRVARLAHAESDFGIQYDSLSDLVTFGLASGLLAYQYSLYTLVDYGGLPGKLGWLAAFIYAAATALRLARFNVTRGPTAEKKVFLGLPCPAAAGLLVGFIWASADFHIAGATLAIPIFLLTICAGLLMVSGIRYNSFKNFHFGDRVPFRYILIMVAVLILIVLDPPRVLFIGFLIYAASGPFTTLMRRRRLRRKRRKR